MHKVNRILLLAGIVGANNYTLSYSIKSIKYLQIVQSLGLLLFCSALFMLPIDKPLSRIFIGAWIFCWLIEGSFIRKWSNVKILNYQWFLLSLPILYYLLNVVSLFYSSNFSDGIYRLEIMSSLLVFPLVYIFANKTFFHNKDLFLQTFLIGSMITAFICLCYGLVNSFSYQDNQLVFQHALKPMLENESFFALIGNRLSHLSYVHLAMTHHPGYLAMYFVFCIAIAYYYFKRAKSTQEKSLYLLSIFFLYIMTYLLSSRAGLISLLGVLLFLTFVELRFTKYPFIVILVSMLLNFGVFKAISISKIKENAIELKVLSKKGVDIDEPEEQLMYKGTRLNIWNSSIKTVKNSLLMGYGIGDRQVALMNRYAVDDFDLGLKIKFNSHNQYLDSTLAGGILGLILLLAMLGFGFVYAIIHKQILLGVFSVLVGFNFMVESMFDTMAGVVFFSFFYGILSRYRFKSIKQLQS